MACSECISGATLLMTSVIGISEAVLHIDDERTDELNIDVQMVSNS